MEAIVPEAISAVSDAAASIESSSASTAASSATSDLPSASSTPIPSSSTAQFPAQTPTSSPSPSDSPFREQDKPAGAKEDLNAIHPAPVEANSVVLQGNVPAQQPQHQPVSVNYGSSPSNFNTVHYDYSKIGNQSFDTKTNSSGQGMNLIRSLFNQPPSERNYSNFVNSGFKGTDTTSQSLSKLSSAIMMGPRLSIDPTINIGQKQSQPQLSRVGVGSQR